MEKQQSWLDSWLRPLGALVIALLGTSFIALSFFAREVGSGGESTGWKERALLSSTFVENWFYDLRASRFYEHKHLSPHLVILEITDESLTKIGRWPWTRSKHAVLLQKLRQYGAKTVMYDAAFPEPENDEADKAFASGIDHFSEPERHAVVLGYGATDAKEDALLPFPDALYTSSITTGNLAPESALPKYIDKNKFAAPALSSSKAAFGFIDGAEPDIDGVFRHSLLVIDVDNNKLPSLGLGGFIQYHSNGTDKMVKLESDPRSPDFLVKVMSNTGSHELTLNPRGELKMRFFGGTNSFARVPAHEVFFDPNPDTNETLKKLFQDKAVLIGSSAFAAHDLRHSPVDSQMPGMYMHANTFHALDQNYQFQPEYKSVFYSLALYLLGITAALFLARLRDPLYEAIGTFALIGLLYASDYYYFAPRGFFIRLFFVLNGSVLLYAWFTLLNVFKEAREKKKIREAFSRYVAPEIVKEMLANPDKLKVGGEKKEITMLFSDVRDFTTISERLTAQELATLLNIYMGQMTDILFETGGTLDKYIGDAMVGFWGAPLDVPDHAYHAVRGARAMLEALPAINQEFEKRKFPRINVGIGLNTGEVSVGNMGSDKIFQYTALGDSMNLASRLESLTKYYGVNLMISEFTYEKLGARRNEFCIRPLDLVQVKGKSKAVKIFEVIPNWSPWANKDSLLAQYVDAYEQQYLQRRFPQALASFQEILQQLPDDKVTLKLLHSTQELVQQPPPPEWDGVTVFTTK